MWMLQDRFQNNDFSKQILKQIFYPIKKKIDLDVIKKSYQSCDLLYFDYKYYVRIKINEKIKKMQFDQFLFLYFLGPNFDCVTFKKALDALADQKTSDMYALVPPVPEMATHPKKGRLSDHSQDPHKALI